MIANRSMNPEQACWKRNSIVVQIRDAKAPPASTSTTADPEMSQSVLMYLDCFRIVPNNTEDMYVHHNIERPRLWKIRTALVVSR